MLTIAESLRQEDERKGIPGDTCSVIGMAADSGLARDELRAQRDLGYSDVGWLRIVGQAAF